MLAGLVVLVGLAVWGLNFYHTIVISRGLIHSAVPYQLRSEDHSKTLLILGDSTAFGVGADKPEDTLGGRVSAYERMTYVENNAVSGALTKDLAQQIRQARLPQYDLILIQISGNDIIRFNTPKSVTAQLSEAIRSLPPAKKVIIVAPGDVGGSTLFPKPVDWIYTWLNRKYAADFAAAVPAAAPNAVFVNFAYAPATKLIKENPKTYLAADGLHPSSAGYALWFEDVKSSL